MRLLYFIFSSSILIGLVLSIRKMFRKQIAPGMLYVLWLIPLIRLLFPFGFWEPPVSGTAAEIFGAPYTVLSEMAERLTEGKSVPSDEQNGTSSRAAGGVKAGPMEGLSGEGEGQGLQNADSWSMLPRLRIRHRRYCRQIGRGRNLFPSLPQRFFLSGCAGVFFCVDIRSFPISG